MDYITEKARFKKALFRTEDYSTTTFTFKSDDRLLRDQEEFQWMLGQFIIEFRGHIDLLEKLKSQIICDGYIAERLDVAMGELEDLNLAETIEEQREHLAKSIKTARAEDDAEDVSAWEKIQRETDKK